MCRAHCRRKLWWILHTVRQSSPVGTPGWNAPQYNVQASFERLLLLLLSSHFSSSFITILAQWKRNNYQRSCGPLGLIRSARKSIPSDKDAQKDLKPSTNIFGRRIFITLLFSTRPLNWFGRFSQKAATVTYIQQTTNHTQQAHTHTHYCSSRKMKHVFTNKSIIAFSWIYRTLQS